MNTRKTWKQAREEKGMKQVEVAEKLGMSRELYNMKENYKRAISTVEALQLEKILNVDIHDIILEKRE